MGFGGLFRGFVPAFDPGGVVAAVPWWLSGGIAAANCLAAYTPKGAASLAASYDNNAAPGNGLADGTYDAAPGVAPTWASATGWTFAAASSQYLDTGITLSAGYAMIAQYSGATANNANLAGHYASSQRFELHPIYSKTNVGYGYGNSVVYTVAPLLAAGNLCLVPTQGYRNGIAEQTIHGTWSGTSAYTLVIGGRRRSDQGGIVDMYLTGTLVALAVYKVAPLNAQILAVSTAMAAL